MFHICRLNYGLLLSITISILATNASSQIVRTIDTFGTGANLFNINFVTISGATNPISGFGIVNNNYRISTYEITNDQWSKFTSSLGVTVTGSEANAYGENPDWPGINMPTNRVSWYEAAQFVNWLNTSTGYHEAYKFTGTQGQRDYTLDIWSAADAENGTNLYRHKDAFYYLPTEDEWVKAAYWNGTALQTYATKDGDILCQGDGASGLGWNYDDNGYAMTPYGPWIIGSGSEEINGTFDMMGNVCEWMESPLNTGVYRVDNFRVLRGGTWADDLSYLESSTRNGYYPFGELLSVGFRVASDVPEPATLSLLAFGGLALLRRRR